MHQIYICKFSVALSFGILPITCTPFKLYGSHCFDSQKSRSHKFGFPRRTLIYYFRVFIVWTPEHQVCNFDGSFVLWIMILYWIIISWWVMFYYFLILFDVSGCYVKGVGHLICRMLRESFAALPTSCIA